MCRVIEDGKQHTEEIGRTRSGLRMGYTTGSCAAAAAKAAAWMLLSGEEIRHVRLHTPKGIELYLEVEQILREKDKVSCAIRKDAGDDPDVTHGMEVYASVERRCAQEGSKFGQAEKEGKERSCFFYEQEVALCLDGGEGVGRVTRPGLEQMPGQPAINRVPRKMIFEAVAEVCNAWKSTEPLKIVIAMPDGKRLAKQTFNPRLGIEGGLSVLGTSGIVEPMSEKALTDTIWLEMKMLHDQGHAFCYVVPGNYGADFLKDEWKVDGRLAVKCSNYVGEAIDDAGYLGMKGILLIGHIGKFIKLAAGVMNTHSRQADCRMEVLASHAAMAGAGKDVVREIMNSINTDTALLILRREGLLEAVMETVMERIDRVVSLRASGQTTVGVVLFSKEDGVLGVTRQAEELRKQLRKEELAWKEKTTGTQETTKTEARRTTGKGDLSEWA